MPLLVPDTSSSELASRLGATAVMAKVVAVRDLGPSVKQIHLAHDAARQLAGIPGNDVMIRLADSLGGFVRRRYSVRDVSDDEMSFSLWVTTGHSGVGSTWAREVAVGDYVDVVGPRGKIPVAHEAQWHLFIGDLSGLGAFCRMAESLTAPGVAQFVIEVDDPADVHFARLPEGVSARTSFVQRGDRSLGDPSALLSALSTVTLGAGDGHAYLFGEMSTSQVIRRELLDRGLADEQISLKSFWRAGRSNEEHGEPLPDR